MTYADSPVAVMQRLAAIEDEMAELGLKYAEAAEGEVRNSDRLELTKAELFRRAPEGTIPQKDAWVKDTMKGSQEYQAHVDAKATHDYCKAMFKVLDARRSACQSILAMHRMTAEEARFGRGRPQPDA